jgi:hypothetical protein
MEYPEASLCEIVVLPSVFDHTMIIGDPTDDQRDMLAESSKTCPFVYRSP